MPFGQVQGFFVDSCVLLPHQSESIRKSCIDFLKEAASRCSICSSVKNEAFEVIDRAYGIIVSDFRANLKPFLEKNGIKELTNRHGKTLASFFSERKRSFKITFPQRSNVRSEIIGAIENYVASQLHSLKDGVKIATDDFIASMMTQLAIVEHDLKAPFMGLRLVEIKPNVQITSLIVLKALIANPRDVEHLGSALEFQYKENKWVIFVTTDDAEILSKERDMFEVFGLQCSKPEWALDYYRDMTRMKSPIEHFHETPNYTERQKEFGKTIEKAMGIKILSL